MRLGDHVGKGAWALAEKLLVPVYGLGVIIVAFRLLPKNEIGVYALLQTMFQLLLMMSVTLALKPMVKYVAEREREADIVANALLLDALVLVGPAVLLLGTASVWGELYDSERLADSIWILLPLAVVTVPRATATELLKARYRTKEMFAVSAVFWLGSLAGLVGLAVAGRLGAAVDILGASCGAGLVASLWGMRYLAPSIRRGRLARHDIGRLVRFGRHAFGVGASTYLFREADVWILARLLGMELLGFYNAARVVCRFYTVGNQFLETVVFPKASELSSRALRSELAALYEKVVCFFMLLLVPFNTILLLFAPQLLDILYAGRFTEAAGILRLLVLGSFAWPLVAIAGNVLQATDRPALAFRLMAMVLPLHWVLVVVGVRYLGVPGAPLAILVSRGVLAWLLNTHVAAHVGTSPSRVLARTGDAWRFMVSFGKRPLTR